ncbi:MAG TPA: PAS domain-containing protein [Azospirillum sp.]|nr:PAS domain-containing protein [Azospirillum sp.]
MAKDKGQSGGMPADLSSLGGVLLDAMPMPVFVRGADGRWLGCNRTFRETFGGPPDEDALAQLNPFADAGPAVHEARLRRCDGVALDVLVHLNPFADAATGLSGTIGVVVDVSDRKRAERGLAEATVTLEEAYRTARLGYWEYGIHTGRLVLNDEAYAIYGHDPADVEPTFDGLLGILHPDDRLRFGNMLESVIGNPSRVYVEYRVIAADGRVRAVSSSCAPRYDEQGRLAQVFGVMLDTTDRAEAAAALRAAKERLEEAHRTGRLGFWEYAIRTGELEWNREAFDIHGQDPQSFTPTFDGLMALLHPDDRLSFGNMLEGVIGNSRRAYFEYRVIDPAGDVRTVSSSCAPRFDADGRLTHVFGVMLDMTERARAAAALTAAKEAAEAALEELRAAQDSLVQAEKMASLGQLVAGVAHEINGPAGVVLTTASHLSGRTDDLKRQFRDGTVTKSTLAAYLEMATEASQLLVTNTERVAALVQTFKQVAADQTGDERRVFYLKDYIEDVLLSLHTQIGPSGHRIHVTCPEALQLESYPGAFARVLTHLVRNALQHAFPPGQRGHVVIAVDAGEDKWIVLRHADDGRGIPADEQAKVFDPFHTTARHLGCVGLGLHIAYNLTTQTLGGQLTVESRPGEGAAFVLRLPRSAPVE